MISMKIREAFWQNWMTATTWSFDSKPADAIAFLVLLAIAGTVVRHDHVTGSLGLSHGW